MVEIQIKDCDGREIKIQKDDPAETGELIKAVEEMYIRLRDMECQSYYPDDDDEDYFDEDFLDEEEDFPDDEPDAPDEEADEESETILF